MHDRNIHKASIEGMEDMLERKSSNLVADLP